MRSRILEALKGVRAADILSPDQRRTRPDRYARHVLYGDPGGRFTILSLVWAAGQFSPVHAHHAWCAYVVHEGTLEETIYGFDSAAMKAHPLRTGPRHAGYCCFDQAGPDHIHRLGNGGAEPALSIHVYGVAREHIETRVNRLVDA
jgi:predicted metal-dependent enzyme (double-stranded beta helix superfamily)